MKRFNQNKTGLLSRTVYGLLLLLIFADFTCLAQSRDFLLDKAGSIYFQQTIFVFGIRSSPTCQMVVYKTDSLLNPTDSLFIASSQKSADDFLQFSADSLHGVLQIYAQTKNKQEGVMIIRPAKNLAETQIIKNIDRSRLNNQQLFGLKKMAQGELVYDLNSSKDSTGEQFYLNAYQRITAEGNYDYRQIWQFPVERKGIYDLHIVHADQRFVYLYAYRKNAMTVSQWLLKIGAKKGDLIKATRIASEKEVYRLGALRADKKGNLILCGQIMRAVALPGISLWTCTVDSTGQVSENMEKKILLNSGPELKKKPVELFANLTGLNLLPTGMAELTFQVLDKSSPGSLKLLGAGKTILSADPETMAKPEQVQISAELLFYYSSPDVKDRNGKIITSEEGSLGTLFELRPSMQEFPHWQAFSGGTEGWLLIRTDLRKNQRQFDCLKLENKKTELKNLQTISLASQPWLQETGLKKVLIAHQNSPGNYRITIYNW